MTKLHKILIVLSILWVTIRIIGMISRWEESKDVKPAEKTSAVEKPVIKEILTPAINEKIVEENKAIINVSDNNQFFAGTPEAKEQVTILNNTGYVSGYSSKHRQPLWVAFKTSAPIKYLQYVRDPKFMPDTRVSNPVKNSDYNSCGYSRGHMATSATIYAYYGDKAEQEAFLLTNIIPQKQANNVGCWKSLEELSTLSKGNWTSRYNTIYIICGPIFSGTPNQFKGIDTPTALYKLVMRGDKNNPELLSFEMDNSDDAKAMGMPLNNYLVELNKIENDTGIKFYPELNSSPVSGKTIW